MEDNSKIVAIFDIQKDKQMDGLDYKTKVKFNPFPNPFLGTARHCINNRTSYSKVVHCNLIKSIL